MSSTQYKSNNTSTVDKTTAVDKFMETWVECPDYLKEKLCSAIKCLVYENKPIDKKDLEKLTEQVVQTAYQAIPAMARTMYIMDMTLQLTQYTKVYDLLEILSKM